MTGSFEIETDQTNAFLAWEYRGYGTFHRIPSLIFTEKMPGFHAIFSDHFTTLTFCTFSNSKMNVFGDFDFLDTYFPYIYLAFLKPTHTGFIEKRPIFQVFGIFRQLQKIPDAQFQSGSHLSGATQVSSAKLNSRSDNISPFDRLTNFEEQVFIWSHS